jgi:hypothetical protein
MRPRYSPKTNEQLDGAKNGDGRHDGSPSGHQDTATNEVVVEDVKNVADEKGEQGE